MINFSRTPVYTGLTEKTKESKQYDFLSGNVYYLMLAKQILKDVGITYIIDVTSNNYTIKLYKNDVCFKKVFCPQYYGFKLYKVAKQVSKRKTFKAIEESDTITQLINKAK